MALPGDRSGARPSGYFVSPPAPTTRPRRHALPPKESSGGGGHGELGDDSVARGDSEPGPGDDGHALSAVSVRDGSDTGMHLNARSERPRQRLAEYIRCGCTLEPGSSRTAAELRSRPAFKPLRPAGPPVSGGAGRPGPLRRPPRARPSGGARAAPGAGPGRRLWAAFAPRAPLSRRKRVGRRGLEPLTPCASSAPGAPTTPHRPPLNRTYTFGG
jgi:hypothetical protein